MPGLSFLNKKSWHTTNVKNVERVWLAEKKAEEEQKRLAELQKQLQEERQILELRQLQAAHGQVTKTIDNSLDWMYEGPVSSNQKQQSSEEYLLGKIYNGAADHSKVEAIPDAKAPAKWLNKVASKNDSFSRAHEDPFVMIKQEENRRREKVVNNPIKMDKIKQKIASELQEKEDKKRQKKLAKREKKEHKKEAKRRRKEGRKGENEKDGSSSSSGSESEGSDREGRARTEDRRGEVKREESPLRSARDTSGARDNTSAAEGRKRSRSRSHSPPRDVRDRDRRDNRDIRDSNSRPDNRTDTKDSTSHERGSRDSRDRNNSSRRDSRDRDRGAANRDRERERERSRDRGDRDGGRDRGDKPGRDQRATDRYRGEERPRDGRDLRDNSDNNADRRGSRDDRGRDRNDNRADRFDRNARDHRDQKDTRDRRDDRDRRSNSRTRNNNRNDRSDAPRQETRKRERSPSPAAAAPAADRTHTTRHTMQHSDEEDSGHGSDAGPRKPKQMYGLLPNKNRVPTESSGSGGNNSLGPNPALLQKKLDAEKAAEAERKNRARGDVRGLSEEERQRRILAMQEDAQKNDAVRTTRHDPARTVAEPAEENTGNAAFLESMRKTVYTTNDIDMQSRIDQNKYNRQSSAEIDSSDGFLRK